ncbi:hypothetical protein Hanom_Chr12g01140551 [Helianthus anomalus]
MILYTDLHVRCTFRARYRNRVMINRHITSIGPLSVRYRFPYATVRCMPTPRA